MPIVLIVDDSPEALSLLNETLEQAGFTALIALDGNQAFSIACKMVPDIILLDAIMPHCDGFETCKKFKEHPQLSDIPIIFMTGLVDTENIVKGLELGGIDYLTKPINTEELIARMRVHLATAQRTNSMNSALDSSGHNLFTVDDKATIVWATPQTRQLFSKANASSDWLQDDMSPQVKHWLNTGPNEGQGLDLANLDYPLRVKMVEKTKTGGILLKLIDGNAPNKAEKLAIQLPVTEKESQVLYWVAHGKTNREIALILDSSPRTINKHLEQIFKKLEVDNRTSAAAIAIRLLATD